MRLALAAGEKPPKPIHNPTKIDTSRPSSFFPHGIQIKEGKPRPVNPPSSWWPFSKSDTAAPIAKSHGTASTARASTASGLRLVTKSVLHHATAVRAAVSAEVPTQSADARQETSARHSSASLLRAAQAPQPTAEEATQQGAGGAAGVAGGAEEGDGKRAEVSDAHSHARSDTESDPSYRSLVLNAQAVCVYVCVCVCVCVCVLCVCARACERASVGGWETLAVLVKLAARWRHLPVYCCRGFRAPDVGAESFMLVSLL